VDELAILLTKALPLADYLNSDECDPHHRSALRAKVIGKGGGDEGVFELSNLLNRLCSERARGTF
jgi:hypothetical protein